MIVGIIVCFIAERNDTAPQVYTITTALILLLCIFVLFKCNVCALHIYMLIPFISNIDQIRSMCMLRTPLKLIIMLNTPTIHFQLVQKWFVGSPILSKCKHCKPYTVKTFKLRLRLQTKNEIPGF